MKACHWPCFSLSCYPTHLLEQPQAKSYLHFQTGLKSQSNLTNISNENQVYLRQFFYRMVKSVTQRQRDRRERLRHDPEALKAYQEADRKRKRNRKSKMTLEEKLQLREKEKNALNKFRTKRRMMIKRIDQVPPGVYKSPCTLGKAHKKVQRALPNSPRKRAI